MKTVSGSGASRRINDWGEPPLPAYLAGVDGMKTVSGSGASRRINDWDEPPLPAYLAGVDGIKSVYRCCAPQKNKRKTANGQFTYAVVRVRNVLDPRYDIKLSPYCCFSLNDPLSEGFE
jgi:hypothetical protein